MKKIERNEEKRMKLIQDRGLDLVIIANKIQNGEILGIYPNENYPNQRKYLINYNNYPCIVPVVEDDEKMFLKTARPDRTKKDFIQ